MIGENYIQSRFTEGSDIGTAALLRHPNGTPMVKADITKWQVRIYDLAELDLELRARPVYALEAVLPASENTNAGMPATPFVISDTLRLDGYWPASAPSLGYNFLHFVKKLGTNVRANDGYDLYVRPFNPKGERIYRLEYAFLTTSGQLHLTHDALCVPTGSTGIA